MKITLEKLNQLGACRNCCRILKANFPDGGAFRDVVERAIEIGAIDDAMWLALRVLTKKDAVRYAIFAAREVLPIYEEKHPGDKRPRKAIEAAEAWLANPCEETARAADAAVRAAYACAKYAARAEGVASCVAEAAYAASCAAEAARAARAVRASACVAAAAAVAAACTELKVKLLRYAVELAENEG